MSKTIFKLFAIAGISCFLIIFWWLNPKVQSLLDKSNYLLELGLLEEAESYREQAGALNDWTLPIATIGFIFALTSVLYFFTYGFITHDKTK
jgi:hypothetical protein